MELRQIEYFIEVAKREHVTEAALSLHVAQSAVSRQIANLEDELGVDLFIREGRRVKLTHIGQIFLEHMEVALKVIENAKREVEEYLDPNRGLVRIGYPSSLASYTLPTVISAFREKYPDVRFSLKQGSYRYLVESVINGSIDMALLGPLPNEEKVKGEVLFHEELVAVLPSNHPLAKEKKITLNDLQEDSFVLFPEGYVLRDFIVKVCKEQGFEPKVSFEGQDIDAIKGLVSASLGISIIPESTLIDSVPRQTVKIPIVEPKVTRGVGIIIPKERLLLPTEGIFYNFVKSFFSVLNRYQY